MEGLDWVYLAGNVRGLPPAAVLGRQDGDPALRARYAPPRCRRCSDQRWRVAERRRARAADGTRPREPDLPRRRLRQDGLRQQPDLPLLIFFLFSTPPVDSTARRGGEDAWKEEAMRPDILSEKREREK